MTARRVRETRSHPPTQAPSSLTPWHSKDAAAALAELGSDAKVGLGSAEAAARLAAHGPNEVALEAGRGPLRMLAAQFADVMILVLVVAAIVSGVLGEIVDTVAILVIVLLNAAVGAGQEYRAQRAIAALRRMAAPRARVVRDGADRIVCAREVVPGDLVRIEAGDVVPADLRLLETSDLQVDESALTGESLAVDKASHALDAADAPIAERSNIAFKSTSVVRGRGTGVTVATAAATQIGHIAELLRSGRETRTPLQERLARFGRRLALIILVICAVVFGVGLLQGQPPLLMFLTSVSLAVAAVPEALPAVVTISLALGARKLARQRALVRRLPAVEALGSVTYICSDKTGTLTQNRMTVSAVETAEGSHETLPGADAGPLWQRVGETMALNNDLPPGDVAAGDPTERALVEAAEAAGFRRDELGRQLPRVADAPFDSTRKRMTTVHRREHGAVVLVKGAPEEVLTRCAAALTRHGPAALDRAAFLARADALARQGYRVLALATRELDAPPDAPPASLERELTFLALVGMTDPLRPESAQAVADCRTAGIVPVMVTGDHPDTARRIAADLGMDGDGDRLLGAKDLAALSDAALRERVRHVRVYARVDPEQKIRIVEALQDSGEYVAMTGDGVNDAPALERAAIGVAMGKGGTDVAREAADIVLLDDNFATIVSAVREGRRIYDDIRKFIKYTLTSNSGEVWTLFLAPLLGLPIPLLPIQILWINLVTDGLPGLALSAEPAERDVMRRPPRPPGESVFARGLWQHMLWVGLLIGGLALTAQAWGHGRGVDYWQTMVFTTLVMAQLFHALAIRSDRDSLLRRGLASNPLLLAAVLLTLTAQLAIIYVPALQPVFKTASLPLPDLLGCIALGAVTLVAVEAEKWLVRHRGLYAGADHAGPT